VKRFAWMLVLLWVFAAPALRAEEGSVPAGAPSAEQPNTAEGCMPGGGCCGACAAARAQAQMQQGQQGQQGQEQAPKLEDAGSCPCKRAQQKTM
jgi:hypothetical protein